MPLTAWTLRDTPGIEELTQQGVWDWTGKREFFRYAYLQGEYTSADYRVVRWLTRLISA